MDIVTVNVRWNKEKFDVDLNAADSPMTFKAQMFALTGVQPNRQKIMFKGKIIGDDSWQNFPVQDLQPGSQMMMMGSADQVPEKPKEKSVFIEDMSDAQLNKALEMPVGLKNLGNTCYMNASIQCLKMVPELIKALKGFTGSVVNYLTSDGGAALTAASRDLYTIMDSSVSCEVAPLIMLNALHNIMPQFAEKDSHGHLQQQDANEFWLEMLRTYQNKLKIPEDNTNIITKYFGGRFEITYKCLENPEEAQSAPTKEDFLQLSCFLSQDIKYLSSGLKSKLVEEIVKLSPTLTRDAKYEKSSVIDRLPAYLTVQMVRFFYKEKDKVNAKILKDVKFPLVLDIFDLCSGQLKEKLKPQREIIRIQDEKVVQREKMLKIAKADGKEMEKDANLSKAPKTFLPTSFDDDVGSNNSGMYDLKAVLTHKGRSSSSGHYVGWVKKEPNDWLKCDDDEVSRVDDEEILKLSGGGDWHCAYLLLYGPKSTEAPATSSD